MRSDFPTSSAALSFAACAVVVAALGCDAPSASPEPDPPSLPDVPEALATPAGEGAGEPHLATGEDGPWLSWLEPGEGDAYDLRLSRWDGTAWAPPETVASSERFFVNWADFPSVVPVDGVLWGHWLERGDAGGYDYGVRVVRSDDGGESWSEPWTPHTDGTPTEHGFVSTFAHPAGGAGFLWLDGRRFVDRPEHPATEEMTLRTRRAGADGSSGEEEVVDPRVCDCCQTDAVTTSQGPLVVYRDRSPEEIRDIYVSRRVDGAWTEGRPVHADGWEIAACPVNGPAAWADGDRVRVAWFTNARDTAAVKVAFSDDAGATFGEPVRVDDGRPAGRVDLVGLADGSVLVSWIERVGEGGAELRVRRIGPDGTVRAASVVSASTAERAGGFPQMVLQDGVLHFAWTDVAEDGTSTVRVARTTPPGEGS